MVGRLLLLSSLLLFSAFGAAIDKKIERSKARLENTKHAFASMDRKLAEIAKQIASNRKNLKKLDETIAKLDKEIAVNAVLLEEGEKRLESIELQLQKFQKERMEKERKLIDTLTDDYMFGEIIRERGMQSPQNVIESELLSALIRSDSESLKSLQVSYLETLKQSETLNDEAKRIKTMIERLQNRKKEAAGEKERRRRLMAKLEKEKRAYQARLQKLQKEEKSLRKTLAKLNILKKEELLRRKRSKRTRRNIVNGDKLKVRTIGSSYQRHAIGHYRGKKTISPVGRAKVVKKFGPYVDPVYGIKIFNESVTLQPLKKRAKVKNVLNGRVVFVKETPILGKVVIIEHKNNLHTIYAKMDKIAPMLKEGNKIKEGYIIGRVEKELMFEVTQKNRHIDPLELIRLY
jgi:septal ring factor EnvC (AmiA/AmiB activator)